jgi:hypothetical protein
MIDAQCSVGRLIKIPVGKRVARLVQLMCQRAMPYTCVLCTDPGNQRLFCPNCKHSFYLETNERFAQEVVRGTISHHLFFCCLFRIEYAVIIQIGKYG